MASRRGSALYAPLLALFCLAYVWKLSGQFPVEPVSSHLSNFAITGAVVTLLCTPKAFVDAAWNRRGMWWCAAFAVANVVVEVLMGIGDLDRFVNRFTGDFNIADPLDAVAGLVAVGVVLFALSRRRTGIRAPATA